MFTGRVVQRGDNLSISAELIDVRNNRQLWGDQFNRKVTDMLAMQEEITGDPGRLRLKLTGETDSGSRNGDTQNVEAYQLYLKGRYYWNKKTPDGFNRGIEYFQKAIGRSEFRAGVRRHRTCYTNLANYNSRLLRRKRRGPKRKPRRAGPSRSTTRWPPVTLRSP